MVLFNKEKFKKGFKVPADFEKNFPGRIEQFMKKDHDANLASNKRNNVPKKEGEKEFKDHVINNIKAMMNAKNKK